MISFIGMLAAMVSMALATCSLALAVVVYRRIRGSATSRQETAQPSPAAAVPATVVVAGGGAVGGTPGRLLITPCWFSCLVAPLDAWSTRLVVSCLRTVGEQLLSSRVPVGCWSRAGQCWGSLLVMPRLVRLWPLVAAWVGRRLATCRVVGRGPPVYGVHLFVADSGGNNPL